MNDTQQKIPRRTNTNETSTTPVEQVQLIRKESTIDQQTSTLLGIKTLEDAYGLVSIASTRNTLISLQAKYIYLIIPLPLLQIMPCILWSYI